MLAYEVRVLGAWEGGERIHTAIAELRRRVTYLKESEGSWARVEPFLSVSRISERVRDSKRRGFARRYAPIAMMRLDGRFAWHARGVFPLNKHRLKRRSRFHLASELLE